MDISDSEAEGEDAEVTAEIRVKRKARNVEWEDSSDNEEEGVEDFEAYIIMSVAQAFWAKQFTKVRLIITLSISYSPIIKPKGSYKPPPPLSAQGGYHKMSRKLPVCEKSQLEEGCFQNTKDKHILYIQQGILPAPPQALDLTHNAFYSL